MLIQIWVPKHQISEKTNEQIKRKLSEGQIDGTLTHRTLPVTLGGQKMYETNICSRLFSFRDW